MTSLSSLLILPSYIIQTDDTYSLRYKKAEFAGKMCYFFYQEDSYGNKSELHTMECCFITIPEGHNPMLDQRYVATYAEIRSNW